MLLWLTFAEAAFPCATMRMLPDAPELRHGVVSRAGPTKQVRDLYGLPNELRSENFVVRWGSGERFTEEELDNLLESMELGWSVEVEDMAHPPPYGADAFLFNVYIGNTGDGAPEITSAAGYFYPDPEGWPMIVMAPETVRDRLGTEGTAVHEFYHAIQATTGRYPYDGIAAWYWEATAEWAAMQVVPDNPMSSGFAFGYLLLPHLPVNYFDYPDEGLLEEYHQYGAYLFPHDLTEQVGWELVRDTWLDPSGDPDPLEVMRGWLADHGHDMDELWLDHIARNVVLDYPFRVWLEQSLESGGWGWPEADRVAVEIDWAGDDGRVRGDSAPGRYGAFAIHLTDADPGTLRVLIEAEPEGTEGSPTEVGARVVRLDAFDDPIYTEVPFDGLVGELSLPDILMGEDVWVVVGTWTPEARPRIWDDERFELTWSVTVEPVAAPVDTEQEKRRCGCQHPGGGAAWWLSGGAAWLVKRRRRAHPAA